MKIGHLDNKPALTPATSERKAVTSTAPGPAAAVEPSAQVALSPSLTALTSHAPEASFDSAKVERITQAIREGRFSVDAGAIADKLIANAQELLSRKAS